MNKLDTIVNEISIDLVKKDPNNLRSVPENNQTEELCLLAISIDYSCIKYVKNKLLRDKIINNLSIRMEE